MDNQGSIGSCTSEGVTYTQFTVAVSQYLHHLNPSIEWDPSSGDPKYLFSPKFTYNFSGAGTSYCYQVLRDDGCLPMSISICKKSTSSNSKFWGGSIASDPQSRSWDVGEGLMLEALKYRLNNFEEIEYGSTHSGQLTTTKAGQELLYKIKEALAAGNAVAICGWSSYWQYTRIDDDGLGNLGKRGEEVIWRGYKSSKSTSDGNHCVAIIGYDDDITVTRGGVTMKGAFLVRNSWGDWKNDGNVWLMYDACNQISEFDLFNDPYFYNSTTALVLKSMKMQTPISCQLPLTNKFTPVGETTIDGEKYTTYNISNGNSYLGYDAEGNVVKLDAAGENTLFALIPSNKGLTNPSGEYKDGFLLYAVNAAGNAKYLSSGTYAAGSTPVLTDSLDNPEVICFQISFYNASKEFESMLCMKHYNENSSYEQTGTLYRFSFVYWDKDISIGNPELSVEVEVSAVNRNLLYITLNRTDKNGVTDTFSPAAMDLHSSQSILPDFGSDVKTGLSFSGKANPTEPETGFFSFSFTTLCSFGDDFTTDDFLWGVNIKGSNVKIKSIKFIDKDGNILSKIVLPEDTPELKKGEVYEYVFDQDTELKAYFGAGTYRLKNAGTGKVLTLSSNHMTFAWDEGKNPQESQFHIVYDRTKDEYAFWNYKDTYLFDIYQKKVADDIQVKLNAPNPSKDTQGWNVEITENGTLRISLKNYPEYAFGYNGTDFCINKDSNSDNYRWTLEAVEESPITTSVTNSSGKITVSAKAPKDYTEGTVQLRIIKDGEVIQTVDASGNKDGFTATVDLEKGCYLLTMLCDGNVYGTQVVYTVK